MDKLKFTIVIPVYNIEKYISKCLDSVINQTYGNFQAILIDDGSIDKSGDICDRYADKDSRLLVIHQENKGLSGARNTGIKNANGEWLLFLDGDDLLPNNALEKWNENLIKTNNDVVIARYSLITENNEIDIISSKSKQFKNQSISTKDLEKAILTYNDTSNWSVWKSAYKTNIIITNKIFFDEQINYSEDLFWIISLFQIVDNIEFVDIDIYLYRVDRLGNQTQQINKMMDGVIKTFNKFCNEFNMDSLNRNEKFIFSFLADVFIVLIGSGVNFKGEKQIQRRKMIEDNIRILNYISKTVSTKKRYIVSIIIKLFGINITDKIIKLIKG